MRPWLRLQSGRNDSVTSLTISIGRFNQYERWTTLRDIKSQCLNIYVSFCRKRTMETYSICPDANMSSTVQNKKQVGKARSAIVLLDSRFPYVFLI